MGIEKDRLIFRSSGLLAGHGYPRSQGAAPEGATRASQGHSSTNVRECQWLTYPNFWTESGRPTGPGRSPKPEASRSKSAPEGAADGSMPGENSTISAAAARLGEGKGPLRRERSRARARPPKPKQRGPRATPAGGTPAGGSGRRPQPGAGGHQSGPKGRKGPGLEQAGPEAAIADGQRGTRRSHALHTAQGRPEQGRPDRKAAAQEGRGQRQPGPERARGAATAAHKGRTEKPGATAGARGGRPKGRALGAGPDPRSGCGRPAP